jgi:hypothetical protein
MDQGHVGRVPIKGNTATGIRDQVIPKMRDILMGRVTKGFIMPELVTHDDNDIFCLKFAENIIPVNEKYRQHE